MTQVRNGASRQSELLLKTYGHLPPATIVTTGHLMWIEFYTPLDHEGHGQQHEGFIATCEAFGKLLPDFSLYILSIVKEYTVPYICTCNLLLFVGPLKVVRGYTCTTQNWIDITES